MRDEVYSNIEKIEGAKVLVVDDLETNLAVAGGMLKRFGVKIDCLTSGQEAVDAVRGESVRYDAIFMDHMMPGMDGVEAMHLIRGIDSDYARSVPIIAFTANAIVGNEAMFLQKGFQACISKPIDIARLDAVVHKWVQKKEHRDGAQEQKDGEQEQETGEQEQEQEQEDEEQQNRDGGRELETEEQKTEEQEQENQGTSVNCPRLSIPGFQIEGINLKKGVKRFGDEQTYTEVLRSYALNTPLILEKVDAAIQGSLKAYATIIHGIKGSSSGICADGIVGMAEAMEDAVKAGQHDYVASHNEAFAKAVQKLISGINDMLAQIDKDKTKTARSKPDEETLSKLLVACISHDISGVDTVVAELEAFDYESGGELVAMLCDNARRMNYAEIARKLHVGRGFPRCI